MDRAGRQRRAGAQRAGPRRPGCCTWRRVPLHQASWLGLLAGVTVVAAGVACSCEPPRQAAGRPARGARRPVGLHARAGRRPWPLRADRGAARWRWPASERPVQHYPGIHAALAGHRTRTAMPLNLGVGNHEGGTTRYQLVLLRNGRRVSAWNLSLPQRAGLAPVAHASPRPRAAAQPVPAARLPHASTGRSASAGQRARRHDRRAGPDITSRSRPSRASRRRQLPAPGGRAAGPGARATVGGTGMCWECQQPGRHHRGGVGARLRLLGAGRPPVLPAGRRVRVGRDIGHDAAGHDRDARPGHRADRRAAPAARPGQAGLGRPARLGAGLALLGIAFAIVSPQISAHFGHISGSLGRRPCSPRECA